MKWRLLLWNGMEVWPKHREPALQVEALIQTSISPKGGGGSVYLTQHKSVLHEFIYLFILLYWGLNLGPTP
jgi:hypothetical protein